MSNLHFSGVLIVAAVAFAAPLVLGAFPNLRLPAVVVEIVAGIAIGPAGLGWVTLDSPIAVLALIGLAFLLFLAGLEIELDKLRGSTLRLTGAGFEVSVVLALAVALVLDAAGLVDAPLLVAIILVATSLGVVVPVLKDAGQAGTPFGQLVIAAGSIADFGAIILLSLFFSRTATATSTKLLLLGLIAVLAVAVAVGLSQAGRSMRLTAELARLQDTTAQIRVRGAFVLLVAFVAVAERVGLEAILGAFMAGAILSAVDTDRTMTHPQFRLKLEAIGYGVFIPAFFIASGLRFDLHALVGSTSAIARVPIFLVALAVVRGTPALLYCRSVGRRHAVVAGLLQATSLPFIVAATQIGTELGKLDQATGAALVAAGLVSVLVFPLGALTLSRGGRSVHAGTDMPAEVA